MRTRIVSLITRNRLLLMVAALCLVIGIVLGQQLKLGNSAAVAETADGEHDEKGQPAADNADDARAATCEHNVPIVDCEKCRFEAGVVRIDKSIESLIETGAAEQIAPVKRLTFTGQIQLDQTMTVNVVSTGAGRVEQVEGRLGAKVAEGDVLAIIHSADLGQAKADFLEVQAKLDLAQSTWTREKQLYEKKITSQADYQNAVNELKAAEAVYEAADKRLRLFGLTTQQIAGLGVEKENEAFANLMLRTPRAGTIIAQNISVGKIVDTAETLATVADLSNLWVWCDVYEEDLAILLEHLAAGTPLQATVRVAAFETDAFNGLLDFVGHLVDEHTRTVKMRVQVQNPRDKLRPGMFADVQVVIPLPGRITAVPQVAVMSDLGKDFVFEHLKDDLWVRRDVTVGSRYGDSVEIRSGLANGARIVTGGAFMLKSDILREKMGAGCAD